MTDLLTLAALEIAADLVQPIHPRRVLSVALARLEAAGLGGAYLRLEGNALHWQYDVAHLTPAVLDFLKKQLLVLPASLMPLSLDRAPFLRETLASRSPRYFDFEAAQAEGTDASDAWKTSLEIMRAMGIRQDIHIPIVHNDQAMGVLVVWGDALTPQDCEAAAHLGRILGAALHRTPEESPERQPPLARPDSVRALQSIIAALAVDQPIEQSLVAIRDAMPHAIPNLLAPIFALRNFETGEWDWKPVFPAWAAKIVQQTMGIPLDAVSAPVGGSEAWKALSEGTPVYASDSAELVGHILTPKIARAIQRALRIHSIAVFPLSSGGQVLGLLFACSRKDAWDDEEKDLLRACASSIGLALNNAHLYMRQRRLVRRMTQSLNRAENILLPQSPPQRLQTIVDEAIAILNADAAALYAVQDGGGAEALAYRGISERYARLVCDNFTNLKVSRVAALRVPTRVDDMLSDDVAAPVRAAVLEEGLRCFIALPLIARGHFHGALVLYRKRPVPFSDEAILGAHAYTIISALSYETMRLLQNSERKVAEAEVLRQILHSLTGERDLKSVCTTILEHACRLTDSDSSSLYLWDPATQRLVDQAGTYHGEPLDRATVLKSGEGMAGTVFETGAPVVLDDYYTWPRSLSVVRRKAVGPALGVPIRLGDEIIGVIGLMRDIPKPLYDDEDLELAEALADEVAVSVAHARMKGERDRQQAFAQRILDSVPTMLLVCNAETTETIVVNQRLLDKTGWTREELIGQPWIERCVPPGWRDSLVEVARSLREQEGGYRFFNPILTKDGREISVQWHNTTVRGEDGQPLYIVANGIIADDS